MRSLPKGMLNQKARKMEGIGPQCALEWVSCHRLANNPIPRLDFPVSLTRQLYCPNGVVTSVPGGGLNSNVDEGIAVLV